MLDLESLGITKQELQGRVVETVVDKLMNECWFDEDGEEAGGRPSTFQATLVEMVTTRIREEVERKANESVLPQLDQLLENLVLQKTNEWGEKVGKPMTFLEYLTTRAENYLTENVSYDGKTKGESGGYSWSASTTRVSYLVERHLQYSIETAMKAALKDANSAIVEGIAAAVKMKLQEVASKLRVTAEVR